MIFVFIFGTAVGSFLNVVIDRLPKGESILTGRSHCDFCNHQLRWYELIPLLSFAIQRGRCRECGGKLSWQYLVVELVTGLVTLLVAFYFLSSTSPIQDLRFTIQELGQVAFYLLVTYTLIPIFVIDLKEMIIPDVLILFLVVVSLLFLFLNLKSNFLNHAVSAFGASLFLFLLARGASYILKKPAMGLGDVKFAFAMGLILGWPNIVIAMYLAFVLGAVVALGLMAVGKKKFGQTIPFGPFLAAATWGVMVYDDVILDWYLTLMGMV